MIGLVAVAASALWFGSVSLLVGAPALLAADSPPRGRGIAPAVRQALLAAVLVALAAALAVGLAKAIALADLGGGETSAWARLAGTRFGKVWIVETIALSAALVLLLALRGGAPLRRPALVALAALASVALAAAPFSSHSAGAPWPLATIAVHAAHHVAIALWFGGLLGLLAGVALASRRAELAPELAVLLSRFSRRAPWVMGVIVVTGALLAVAHVGGWPALLATRYGLLLLAKLALLGAALAVAAWIRARLVPRADEPPAGIAPLRRALGFEAAFGGGVLGVAALLAETVPGAHDAVSWWLPFRFSVAATWRLDWVPERVIGGGVAAFLAASVAAGEVVRGRRARAATVAVAGLALGGAIALPALAIRAYPGTYWRSEVPYDAVSVAHGRDLYREHCVRCHGDAGRGDGPLAIDTARPPANLTEPHTADHTAGDMFWWLTHGIPDAGMPPFDAELSPEDRWDLINYLRAFAAGHQAKVLGPRISPERPWLGAIDFNYATADGDRGILRDFRGERVVLLAFFTPGASVERMRTLREWLPAIRERGAEVLAVPLAPAGGGIADELSPLALVLEPSEEIATSYLLFRRTFESPGDARDEDRPEHLELLVDRYGYVRARWRPDDGRPGFADRDLLLGQIAALFAEPEILPPPDDHVH